MVDLREMPTDVRPTIERIQRLTTQVWEGSLTGEDIGRWLDNFKGEAFGLTKEYANALHLLSEFNHFGLREIRELLRSVFRDLYRYPIIQSIRKRNGGTFDEELLSSEFNAELRATRFLGMGNPSESGAHLLYYFRQINSLPKNLFIHQHEILDGPVGAAQSSIAIDGLRRLVFVDDLLGSGSQARQYSAKLLEGIRQAAASADIELHISYFTLFAKPKGLMVARGLEFDEVHSVHELDESAEAFHPSSRAYVRDVPSEVSRSDGRALASHYGNTLFPSGPLGWNSDQLLLGLHHNVPDNTLPIFWAGAGAVQWEPVFLRYDKAYS